MTDVSNHPSVELHQPGGPVLRLEAGRSYRLGRSYSCDFTVEDPSVSRVHLELQAVDGTLLFRDLGSSNGTQLNGAAMAEGVCRTGDRLVAGSVEFVVQVGERESPSPPENTASMALPGTLVREIPGSLTEGAILQQLLGIARQLLGTIDLDSLLEAVARLAFEVARVERVSILLGSEVSSLSPTLSRTREGDVAVLMPPRSILARAVTAGRPILLDDIDHAPELASRSAVLQHVRSAICVPLQGDDGNLLGALYADHSSGRLVDQDALSLFALAGLAAVSVARIHYSEAFRREEIRRAHLARFFSPQVADTLSREAVTPVTGSRRPVTVLFSDVRRFSEIAKAMDPERLARLLTEYFSDMTDIVFAHGGILDKFLGDGVLAIWDSGADPHEEALAAVSAARQMLRVLPMLNDRWEARGDPAIGIGVGIDRGDAFVGTLGGERRLDYTVIGDPVNTASRLSAATAAGEIFITGAVYETLAGAVHAVPVVEPVRGVPDTLRVYRLEEVGGGDGGT